MFPSFSATDLDASQFAPAAGLALKAKQFDDGLYACVEMASDTGIGLVVAGRPVARQQSGWQAEHGSRGSGAAEVYVGSFETHSLQYAVHILLRGQR